MLKATSTEHDAATVNADDSIIFRINIDAQQRRFRTFLRDTSAHRTRRFVNFTGNGIRHCFPKCIRYFKRQVLPYRADAKYRQSRPRKDHAMSGIISAAALGNGVSNLRTKGGIIRRNREEIPRPGSATHYNTFKKLSQFQVFLYPFDFRIELAADRIVLLHRIERFADTEIIFDFGFRA